MKSQHKLQQQHYKNIFKKMKAGFYKLASSLDFASFSTIFKHWSENSINSGSCMADFIASSLCSAPSIEHNNCLRWGLQSRSFSSFDWPGDKENSSYSHYFVLTCHCCCTKLLISSAKNEEGVLEKYLTSGASAEELCQWCHLHAEDHQHSKTLQRHQRREILFRC